METPLLSDRYEVGETLGRGGMADVVAARDSRLGRRVAVKILREDLARDPAFVRRFEAEALAAARLNHPGIVSVFDVGEHQPDTRGGLPLPFIVMEKVSGSTLRTVLDTEGVLAPRRAVDVAADVMAALAYSHEQGVVHNDIKPGNVMVTDDGTVKIMDFGIARALADVTVTLTQPDHVLGTAKYMAPELADGSPAEPASDVYAVGCMLFEMLTGRTPFTGDPTTLVNQHLHVAAPRVSTELPSVSPDLDDLVAAMLAKDPAERPHPASEAERLLRAVAGDLDTPRSATAVTGTAVGHGASSAWGGAAVGAVASESPAFRPLEVDRSQETTASEPAPFTPLDTGAPREDGAADDAPAGPVDDASQDAPAPDVTVEEEGTAESSDDHAPWQPGDDVP
ncbi:protein kinase domain-containing protein, partial [Kytococcus schroeteri]